MSDLWTLGVPVAEKVVRTVLVYGGLAVLLRVAGKRNLAQLNSFDLVVVLLLSNVVQNAIIGPDDSLTGGLLGAVVPLGVNSLVVRIVNRSDLAVRVFEGEEIRRSRTGDSSIGRYARRVCAAPMSRLRCAPRTLMARWTSQRQHSAPAAASSSGS